MTLENIRFNNITFKQKIYFTNEVFKEGYFNFMNFAYGLIAGHYRDFILDPKESANFFCEVDSKLDCTEENIFLNKMIAAKDMLITSIVLTIIAFFTYSVSSQQNGLKNKQIKELSRYALVITATITAIFILGYTYNVDGFFSIH